MKPKVPVIFLGFNRPYLARQTLKCIRDYQPSHLYVVLDGPRQDVPSDSTRCQEMRELIDFMVDWDCELVKDYSDTNLGCANRVSTGITNAFKRYDQAIILEDDLIIDPSFFAFCEEMLVRYQQDDRIFSVTGDNFQHKKLRGDSSYYFSKYMHCWGWATWKRAWSHYDHSITPLCGETWEDTIQHYACSDQECQYWLKCFSEAQRGAINSWAYRWQFSCWKHRGLTITPQVNLVQNIGFGEHATHTFHNSTTIHPLSVLTSEIAFPLKHPKCVEQNVQADSFDYSVTCLQRSFLARHVRSLIASLKKLFPTRHL